MTSPAPDLNELLTEDQREQLSQLIAQILDIERSLLKYMTPAQINRMKQAFIDIAGDTSYGEIKIPVAGGKAQGVNHERKWKE